MQAGVSASQDQNPTKSASDDELGQILPEVILAGLSDVLEGPYSCKRDKLTFMTEDRCWTSVML